MENLKFGVNFILSKSFFAEAVKHEELFERERVHEEVGVPLDWLRRFHHSLAFKRTMNSNTSIWKLIVFSVSVSFSVWVSVSFYFFYSYFISILARLVRIAAGVCEMYMNFFYWVITDRVTSNGHDTCCIIHLASQYQLGNLMSTTWDLPENFTPKISSAILAPIKRTYKADIVIEILIWAEIA